MAERMAAFLGKCSLKTESVLLASLICVATLGIESAGIIFFVVFFVTGSVSIGVMAVSFRCTVVSCEKEVPLIKRQSARKKIRFLYKLILINTHIHLI